MSSTSEKNKRIAKNTLMLYFRMLLTIIVSLYTSRVVLNALGIEDYGIYNVVGGVVAMFNILSGSLSSAISRFITFELGRKDLNKLKAVFSSSVTIQIILAVAITIIAEIAGIWFINEKMNVDASRLSAANWVFHFSILTFAVNLISIPYNAAIVAHEKMSAFAYISILETVGKLLIAYLIMISPIDKLIFYGLLMLLVALLVRFSYTYYCKRNFEECSYHFIWDKQLLKQMFGFAGWNFIGSSSAILRDQGGNLLINLFCGPTVNAARGIAIQVNSAIAGFVSNFMTALRPQITKSYASKDFDYMMVLIYQGARLSFYLLLVLSLPIILNTEYILEKWLNTVPTHTISFVQLVLIFSMSESISNPLVTAMQATGRIRNYQLIVGGLQMLNLPVSYILMKIGFFPEAIFIVSIVI
ncbi:lipopolysaccharide biosynthesis protein, partial [Bacteroides caecigallinarum]|uniref:lipopolysaccharide biosynthesis protein n=1 Tax=Bacteroides caecigallinarum TaxID=1411144 RepID=UPI001EFF459A